MYLLKRREDEKKEKKKTKAVTGNGFRKYKRLTSISITVNKQTPVTHCRYVYGKPDIKPFKRHMYDVDIGRSCLIFFAQSPRLA